MFKTRPRTPERTNQPSSPTFQKEREKRKKRGWGEGGQRESGENSHQSQQNFAMDPVGPESTGTMAIRELDQEISLNEPMDRLDCIRICLQNAYDAVAKNVYVAETSEVLKIEDDGQGIKSQDRGRVARPFYTSKRNSSSKLGTAESTGLPLADACSCSKKTKILTCTAADSVGTLISIEGLDRSETSHPRGLGTTVEFHGIPDSRQNNSQGGRKAPKGKKAQYGEVFLSFALANPRVNLAFKGSFDWLYRAVNAPQPSHTVRSGHYTLEMFASQPKTLQTHVRNSISVNQRPVDDSCGTVKSLLEAYGIKNFFHLRIMCQNPGPETYEIDILGSKTNIYFKDQHGIRCACEVLSQHLLATNESLKDGSGTSIESPDANSASEHPATDRGPSACPQNHAFPHTEPHSRARYASSNAEPPSRTQGSNSIGSLATSRRTARSSTHMAVRKPNNRRSYVRADALQPSKRSRNSVKGQCLARLVQQGILQETAVARGPVNGEGLDGNSDTVSASRHSHPRRIDGGNVAPSADPNGPRNSDSEKPDNGRMAIHLTVTLDQIILERLWASKRNSDREVDIRLSPDQQDETGLDLSQLSEIVGNLGRLQFSAILARKTDIRSFLECCAVLSAFLIIPYTLKSLLDVTAIVNYKCSRRRTDQSKA